MSGVKRVVVWTLLGAAGAFAFGNVSGVFLPRELPILMTIWGLFAGAVAIISDPAWFPEEGDDDER